MRLCTHVGQRSGLLLLLLEETGKQTAKKVNEPSTFSVFAEKALLLAFPQNWPPA